MPFHHKITTCYKGPACACFPSPPPPPFLAVAVMSSKVASVFPPPNSQLHLKKADRKAKAHVFWPPLPTEARRKAIHAKYSKAASHYRKAANGFRGEQDWKQSAQTFIREGECRIKGDQWSDARKAYKNAANSFKIGNLHRGSSISSSCFSSRSLLGNGPIEQIGPLKSFVNIAMYHGKWVEAAETEHAIGELYASKNVNDQLAAVESFNRAADWYKIEDRTL